MAVIVHDDMPIDQALRMLWRETIRENIPIEYEEDRYRIKPTERKHAAKKEYAKQKRRRRAAARKLRKKGIR
ncbi:30S ribosomal protein S21 [Candidatus Dojkabacteria bacterium]|nr:30S ribosomal protein S21 [Candidatus Dojkabacteria bacterium]